jgi:hypothetical protein
MKNWISKIKDNRLKKRYRLILQDRIHLTDYEKYQLIPELRSRLRVLVGYFSDIVTICRNQKGSRLFVENLASIINPEGIPSSNIDVKDLAEKFFDSVIEQAQVQNIDDIERILKEYENIEDVRRLGLFLNEINLLCSSFLEVKNRLFLFKIEAYPHITNQQTGQTIAHIPNQFFLTIEPFQIVIQNILSVCKATSDTIHGWHKENMNIKAQFLDLYNNKITLRNNRIILLIQIVTILLAVALSAFFLSANDPFNLIRENKDLKENWKSLGSENRILKEQLLKLKKD